MIKHLKILARGLCKMWFVWLLACYAIFGVAIAKHYSEAIGLIILGLPVVVIVLAAMYAMGSISSDQ
jgi:amino acid transporter